MRVLVDTNVVLDSLLDRQPFSTTAAQILARVENREIEGILGATTVTTLHYLLGKLLGSNAALEAVRHLLTLFTVAAVDERVLSLAAASSFKDFEDAVLYEAARLAGADAIVTRDPTGFRGADLPVFSPEALEEALRAHYS